VTQPVHRIRKGPAAGDYEVAGRRLYGFSRTKGMKFSKGLEIHKLGEVTLALANKANGGDLLWVREVVMADDPTKKARGIGMKLAEYRQEKADLGTQAHAAIEQVEMGASVSEQPGHLRSWVEGYLACKADIGFRTVATEQTVVNLSVGYAGTCDLILDVPGVGLAIADNKTGIVYADVAIQLTAYANGEHVLDADGALADMPPVSTVTGFVLDVKEHGTSLRAVHLEPAWPAWLACVDLRRWADEDEPKVLTGPLVGLHPARVAWVRDRIERIAKVPEALEALRACWPEGVPTPKQSEQWTGSHIDAIDPVLGAIEGKVLGEPFGGPRDPVRVGYELPWGPPTPEALERTIDRLKALPDDVQRRVAAQAKAGDDPVPNLAHRAAFVTRRHLDRLEELLAEAEADVEKRTHVALAAIDSLGCSKAEADRRFGDAATISAERLALLRQMVTAKVDGLLGVNGDGLVVTTTKASALLLGRHGDEATCLAAVAADVQSLSALCAEPALVAACWAASPISTPDTDTDNNTQEKQPA
jgi:hypothetical protein